MASFHSRASCAPKGHTTPTLALAALLAILLGVTEAACADGQRSDSPQDHFLIGVDLEALASNLEQIPTRAAVELGCRLFADPILSADKTVSCQDCHRPEYGYADNRQFSIGVGGIKTSLNTPSALNRGFGRYHFWNGRAESLERQAAGPLYSDSEMGATSEVIEQRLRASKLYRQAFSEAFDSIPTAELVLTAIASFESMLVTGGSAFDHFEWRGVADALSPAAQRGLALFRGKARCTLCHTGNNFTDEDFHDIGLIRSRGSGRDAFTGDGRDKWRFKTPSLRNVALSAPYMHDGGLPDLIVVIEHYNKGGERTDGSPLIKPLNLSDSEKHDVVAFLESLTGPSGLVSPEVLASMRSPSLNGAASH